MSEWESQIRTNLDSPEYVQILDQAIASAPGMLAAGLVNVRYEEGRLCMPNGQSAQDREVAQMIQLARGLFAADSSGDLPDGYAAAFAELVPIESVHWTTRNERLFVHSIPGDEVLAISVSSALKLGPAMVVVRESTEALRARALQGATDSLASVLQGTSDVLAAALLDPATRTFTEIYKRPDNRTEFAFDDAMAIVVSQFFGTGSHLGPVTFKTADGELLDVLNTQILSASHVRTWRTVPFDPEHLLFVLADRQAVPQGLVLTIANRATEETVRVWADGLLAWGIDAILEPFPKTQREFLEIVEELRHLHENDLISRLRIGGFVNYSMGEGDGLQRCQECIYYHPHRKWCDLPELPIPVEPHWWCRLWKL